MAVVPGSLLGQVEQDPAQRDRLSPPIQGALRASIAPPSIFASIHELSTQRRWLTSPDIVISGEPGSGARRASASDRPAHLARTVSRA